MTMPDTTRLFKLTVEDMNGPNDLERLKDFFAEEFDFDFKIGADYDTGIVTIDGLWEEDTDIIDAVNEAGFEVTYALAM